MEEKKKVSRHRLGKTRAHKLNRNVTRLIENPIVFVPRIENKIVFLAPASEFVIEKPKYE